MATDKQRRTQVKDTVKQIESLLANTNSGIAVLKTGPTKNGLSTSASQLKYSFETYIKLVKSASFKKKYGCLFDCSWYEIGLTDGLTGIWAGLTAVEKKIGDFYRSALKLNNNVKNAVNTQAYKPPGTPPSTPPGTASKPNYVLWVVGAAAVALVATFVWKD